MPDSESMFDQAIQMGQRNLGIIELARKHCLNMEFTPSGGYGMAEEATGLPINMRQVHCPIALGGMASNLEWIATGFYREHCVGCDQRRPTGELPHLGTLVDDQDSAAATAAAKQQAALDHARAEWRERAERRRSLAATSGEAMANALHDIDLLDDDPGSPTDKQERDSGRSRLNALAERAPQTFTPDVIEAAIAQVNDTERGHELLDPLRRLARGRPEYAEAIARAAVAALRSGRAMWAGPCVAELADQVDWATLDGEACRSLIGLAGAPALTRIGRARPTRTNDPVGLQAAAERAPTVVVETLRAMLPPPGTTRSLVLPPGTSPVAPRPVTAFERASAAGAIRALATSAPSITESLAELLLLQMAIPAEDAYDDPVTPAATGALATMLVLDIPGVRAAIERAGKQGGKETRQHLMNLFDRVADLISVHPRRRDPGDPTPDDARRQQLLSLLVEAGASRASGDWGDDARFDGAELLESLAKNETAAMFDNLPMLLGTLLGLVDAGRVKEPAPTALVSQQDGILRGLERMSRANSISSATHRVLKAVEAVARVDAAEVCRALAELMSEDRDTERGPDLAWRLLDVLGRIGRRFGDEPHVLGAVLPILHGHIVHEDVSLRVRAIDAWAEIGSGHTVPSSLVDLLPALIEDRTVGVAGAVSRASVRLTWPEDQRAHLLSHALLLLRGVDAGKHPELIKDAVRAALHLSSGALEALRPDVEAMVVETIAKLDGYDLRDALRPEWLPETTRSSDMAALRLRQAADPQINDRWNRHDDDELCALLSCGFGLTGLSETDLESAALALTPDAPHAAAEFVEVAWRSGDPHRATNLAAAAIASTPDQLAYRDHRSLLNLIHSAARLDNAAVRGGAWKEAATDLTQTVDQFSAEYSSDIDRSLAASASAACGVRQWLAAVNDPVKGDLAEHRRQLADKIAAAGDGLAAASQRLTPTASYLRAVAASCMVASHLLRAEAAVFDADQAGGDAHRTAAIQRASALVSVMAEEFAPNDPLAGPLLERLAAVAAIAPNPSPAALLADWWTLSLPLPIVRGPEQRRSYTAFADYDAGAGFEPRPVAVVLASLDSNLVTGPEVLRPDRVYDLTLEVQTDDWPDWADRLDAELVGHLTPAEITLPEFTWARAEAGEDGTFSKSGSLVLRFALGPGQAAPPFLVALTWRGVRAGQPAAQSLDVAGHRELRLRPYDSTRDRATDYPVFDERLLGLYDGLAREGYDADQLQAFCRLMTAICRVGLRMTWDKQYRRGLRVTEKEFHDDLFARLLVDPELEGRVERGNPLALGYLDVRHDGITAELKVERKVPVTKDSSPKYMGQATQYASADGSRLSILTILDMSPKQLPIGAPENYLFTLQPQLHGLTNPEAPSLVAVLVVNGNVPPPSSYSRRKPPIQSPPDQSQDNGSA